MPPELQGPQRLHLREPQAHECNLRGRCVFFGGRLVQLFAPTATSEASPARPTLVVPAPAQHAHLAPRISHNTHSLNTSPRPPFYAGRAGGFDMLRGGGMPEEQLEKRRKKKAKGGAYGL